MHPFALPDAAKDAGKATYHGKSVERFHWAQTLFKVVPMQTSDCYVEPISTTDGESEPDAGRRPLGTGLIGCGAGDGGS